MYPAPLPSRWYFTVDRGGKEGTNTTPYEVLEVTKRAPPREAFEWQTYGSAVRDVRTGDLIARDGSVDEYGSVTNPVREVRVWRGELPNASRSGSPWQAVALGGGLLLTLLGVGGLAWRRFR